MREISELVGSADVIVVMRVREVGLTQSSKSAELLGVVVKVLKGSDDVSLPVYVELPGPLVLDCDDRPDAGVFLTSLKGSEIILFLERRAGAYWSGFGPDSIYSASYESTVRTALDAEGLTMVLHPESSSTPRGTVIKVSHTITNPTERPFLGCIGSQHSWVFASDKKSTVDRSDATSAPACTRDLELKPGASETWTREVFVPADTPIGPVTISARVQVLERKECERRPCGYAFLTTRGGQIDITADLEQKAR